jgi:hypothetical protein
MIVPTGGGAAPAGGATEAEQEAQTALLTTIDADTSELVLADRVFRSSATFTRPNTTPTYTGGDVVTANPAAIMTFANMARANGGGGRILNITLVQGSNQATKAAFELWLFRATMSMDADDAAFTPTDAELGNHVETIPLTTVAVGDATAGDNGNCVHSTGPLHIGYVCDGADTSLYGVLVVRNAYVAIANEPITVIIRTERD